MSLKRLHWVLWSLVAVVAVVGGCVATPPQTGDSASTGAGGEAAAPAGEQITLRWANIMDATAQEQWAPIIEAFEAENPNIDIVVESTAGSGAAIYPDVLKTS